MSSLLSITNEERGRYDAEKNFYHMVDYLKEHGLSLRKEKVQNREYATYEIVEFNKPNAKVFYSDLSLHAANLVYKRLKTLIESKA